MPTAKTTRQTSLNFGLRLASDLFTEIGQRTFDGIGVTRAAYGEGEQLAHDVVAQTARQLELQIEIDSALNLSVTLPGSDTAAPALIIGSHLDFGSPRRQLRRARGRVGGLGLPGSSS